MTDLFITLMLLLLTCTVVYAAYTLLRVSRELQSTSVDLKTHVTLLVNEKEYQEILSKFVRKAD